MEIGTAHAEAGKIVYGSFEAVELPSGGFDLFPIIIAQGLESGPVLWVTAGIHGNEYTGIPVIHQLITPELVSQLRGTIVAVPTLNPPGLRGVTRSNYYLGGLDPNRLFPAPPSKQSVPPSDEPPSVMEEAYQRLFEQIRQTANYLIDFHNYSLGALTFAFRDPVYYRGGRERAAAQQLQAKMGEMLDAFGHSVINEFASVDYLKQNLHRSVSGACLNAAHIPSFTAELGGYLTVDPDMVKAAVAGTRNVLRWAGMLDGAPEPITGIKVLSPDFPIRRTQHPYAPRSGICELLVKAGDKVMIGDPVARITDIYGRPQGPDDGQVRTEYDGYVLGAMVGGICYRNEPILSLAIRDTGELVLPYPT